jgi:putative ABC transport system substrate-binding protein
VTEVRDQKSEVSQSIAFSSSLFVLRSVSCVLVAITLLAPLTAQAQTAKIPKIGYVSGTGSASDPGPYVEALRQGLRELGYVEGKNFVIEYRGAKGSTEGIPGIVAELIQLKVDILVLPLVAALRAAKQATNTVPVVMITQVDPVATGIIESLARPGGNITGLTSLQRDLSGKRLELLQEAVPKISRVGILRDADDPVSIIGFKDYENAARALKLKIHSVNVRGSVPDLASAFKEALRERLNAIITITNNPLFRDSKSITKLALNNRLPSMYEGSAWVEAGGLLSYSANDLELFRRAAVYVDKILKGTRPADLPVEQPTKFELVINLETARQLGLTIPPGVLARADRVIK